MIFYILKLWKQPSILNKEYFFIQELILFVKKKNQDFFQCLILCPILYICLKFYFDLYLIFCLYQYLTYPPCYFLICVLFCLNVYKCHDLLDNGILKQPLGLESTNLNLCHCSYNSNYKLFSPWANSLSFLKWDLLSLKCGW